MRIINNLITLASIVILMVSSSSSIVKCEINNVEQVTETCPQDSNPCTTETFIYGGCYSIYNQWVDCEATSVYQSCVANCKTKPEYNPCASVACDYETMQCVFGQAWSGCNDNNACTNDACTSTGCVSTVKNCTDNSPLTNDNCQSNFGCYYTVNSSTNNVDSCTTNNQCNDNRPCTTDTCVSGKCVRTINCASNSLCGSNGYCQTIPTPTY